MKPHSVACRLNGIVEVARWCNIHLGSENWVHVYPDPKEFNLTVFSFKHEKDLMLFTLKWL